VVDDDAVNRRKVSELRLDSDSWLRAEPFDVVLLDVLMPEMAGYQTQQMSRA
jgi:DNA-binding response OmpR family regulator